MNWSEHVINEARDKDSTELDLSTYDDKDVLTSFPTEILTLKHLRKLNLSNHKLTHLPPEITDLNSLEELNLSMNDKIKLPSNLLDMPNLKRLNLSGLGLSEFQFKSKKSSNLVELNLSWNELTELPKSITSFKKLESLILSFNKMGHLPAHLSSLNKLSHISIDDHIVKSSENILTSFNLKSISIRCKKKKTRSVTQIDFLTKISTIESIQLMNCLLDSFPMVLASLPNLESLEIVGSSVSRVPIEISKFTKLKALRLSLFGNTPEDSSYNDAFPVASLSKLQKLEQLHLERFPLKQIPEEILNLHCLQELILIDCQINHIPKKISELRQLKRLNLSNNTISELPNELFEVTDLEFAWFYNNQLKEIPKQIENLSKLTTVSFQKNQITCIPTQIFNLTQLNSLWLGENQIKDISTDILKLKSLEYLRLERNQIRAIPKELVFLNKLRSINLADNPIETPPPEIVERGIDAIQAYFVAFKTSAIRRLFEAKLIIVGEGEVGKTCVAKKLIEPNYDILENKEIIKSTLGIEVNAWQHITSLTDKFNINIWDFGGQEIYHSTHQFFLTKRSLYLFIWDARKDDKASGFDYWLNIVRLLSDESPVLVALNKSDERVREIDEEEIKSHFNNIVQFHKISALNGMGMDVLRKQISDEIIKLPHVGDEWPESWSHIREILEKDPRNYISLQEFYNICSTLKVSQSQAGHLSSYLHDLGVILHFQDEPLLRQTVILRPEWGTKAVYSVLDTRSVQDRKGRFQLDELREIWKSTQYPEEKHPELLQLMIKFELCFQLGSSNNYVAPELLSAERPLFTWDEKNNLRFEYNYSFMPAGLITRFIARMHNTIEDEKFWKNGVVLSWRGAKALITSEVLNRKIRISLMGHNRKELLCVIRHEFDDIHNTLNKPSVKEMIPCPCHECSVAVPHLYDFDTLQRYLRKGQETIVCDQSIENIPIRQLLAEVIEKDTKKIINDKSGNTYFIDHYYEGSIAAMTNNNHAPEISPKNNPWISGSFYLFSAVIMLSILATIGKLLNYWILPILILGGLLLITVIGAYQLRNDSKLEEKNFLSLMKLAFQQIPLLGKFLNQKNKC